MEKKTTIKVPDPYLPLLEDIRLLQKDQNNPNMTTIKQQEQIWNSLQKYGWTYPILTNKNGLLVDGETRTEICKQHEELARALLDCQFSVSIPATYEIIVECRDEANQKSIFEKLKLEGYKLRILTL